MECRELVERYIETLKEGFKCIASTNRLRVVTPYVYPDNDLIEIFIEDLSNGRVKVTDLGETFRHLHSQGFDISSSPKRRFLTETIASRVEVELKGGQLSKTGPAAQVGNMMLDLMVATKGIADLIYTSKTYEPATFFEEVKEFLEENHFQVEPRVKITGSSSKRYSADFHILNGHESYLQALSPRQVQGLKGKVDATFRMWSDFDSAVQKLSLLNDIDFEWKEPDVVLLGRVSKVTYWSRKDELVGYLRGQGRRNR